MKKLGLYKKLLLPGCVALVGLMSSCSAFDDFLTVYPTNQITGEQFWEDKNDLNSFVVSCYKQLTDGGVSQRMSLWGEARSDNFILKTESDENLRDIMNANLLPTNSWFDWAGFYRGIGYCNLVISKGDEIVQKDPSFTEGDWKPIEAECKAIRALLYFYLVRSFRDVPFNVKANDTSNGAREPMPQVSSQYILTYLINDLEACKDNGMTDFGTKANNRIRFTKNAIYTLLADLYLWRAAKNTSADSAAKYPGMAQADYQRCIELCDYVIKDKLYEFQKERITNYYGYGSTTARMPLPIYAINSRGRINDNVYEELFSEGCSYESIFEVAYSDETTFNSVINKFYGRDDGGLKSGDLGASSVFQSVSQKPNQDNIAFSKTDIRFVEDLQYSTGTESSTTNSQIVKYVTKSIEILDATDVSKKDGSTSNVNYGGYHSGTSSGSRNPTNWIIYRASDVILMKAEAIACLYPDGDPMLEEGFNLVYSIFDRSNPMIETKDKLTYSSFNTSSALLSLVMKERQREFFAEGKRWFDLVRMALRDNTTQKMLNLLTVKYATNASAIKAKLATLNSLFNPVYKEEMKINTGLVQNPAWIVDEDIVRN